MSIRAARKQREEKQVAAAFAFAQRSGAAVAAESAASAAFVLVFVLLADSPRFCVRCVSLACTALCCAVPAEILQKFNSVLLEYNIHLRYFIHNPFVLNYFSQFCKGEHSVENIEFWSACRDFRRLDIKGGKTQQSEIDQRAEEIKKQYIGNNALQQVNLKGSVEAKVMRGLKEVPIRNTVFIDAEEEILGLMSSDSFGRFKSSDLFKTCIETVNSPYTAILRKLYLL